MLSPAGPPRSARDCLVIGAFERGEMGAAALDARPQPARPRAPAAHARGLLGSRGETLLLPEVPGLASGRLLLVGLGVRAQFNRRGWRRALQTAITALARTRIASAAIALERPAARELDDYYFGRSIAEITGASLYRVNDLKTERRARPPALARILVGPVEPAAVADVRRGLAAGRRGSRERAAAAQPGQSAGQRLHAALSGHAGARARAHLSAPAARARIR